MALTLHDSTTPKAPPRTVRFDELPAATRTHGPAPAAKPTAAAGPVEVTATVTAENWEEVYWQEVKNALFDPVLDFPDAFDAVQKRLCTLKDEVFAKHHIT